MPTRIETPGGRSPWGPRLLRLCAVLLCAGFAPVDTGAEDAPTVRAAGHAAPWIRFRSATQLPAPRDAGRSLSRPLAMATADFDEDGVPDLAVGYAAAGGGQIVLYRGNPESRHWGGRAPFLLAPEVLETPA